MPHHQHDHVRGEQTSADRRVLSAALALILGVMALEVVGGLVAGSLALLADAAHMLTDAAALGLALFAAWMAGKPPHGRWTFGFRRLEVLAAQANGIALVLVGLWILYAAATRLADPPEVHGWIVVAVAGIGAGANLAATALLARAGRESINVRGAFVHVATDLAAFAATAVAGALVLVTDWDRFDPLASLAVTALMFWASAGLVRESTRIFLETSPGHLDPEAVGRAIVAEPEVVEVHDLHIWTVTSGFPALSAHVLVEPGADCHAARRRLERLLGERFALTHTTLQVDHAGPRTDAVELGAPYRRETPLERR